jgi:predicted nicotinamide N-methyase
VSPDPTPERDPLETELRARFDVRTERFAVGGFDVELLLPRTPEDLIDVSAFNSDERLPYWAELWPSGRALARWLVEAPALPAGPAIELGCGVALPALALAGRSGELVLATDYYADALEFAIANARRNGDLPLGTRLLDWRDIPPELLGRFGFLLAADVLYELRNVEMLAEAISHLLAPGGTVWLADPRRVYLSIFRDRMREAGWTIEEESVREPSNIAPEGSVEIRLLTLRRG